MAHSIGKTIAKLRKEKGWTQAELAEKLQVSYKAVSKWEIEDSFPSIEFFPLLAKLFDVSIDYLMTGKIENVNLDDMDATKRIHYLIENDDLENFKKYDCIRIAIPTRNYSSSLDESIWRAILKESACSIFGFCCDEFINTLPQIIQRHQSCSNQDAFGYYIRNFTNEFVKGVVDLDRSDILEAIGFRTFAVGEVPAISRRTPEKNPFHPRYNDNFAECVDTPYAYWIKKETLKYFFENREKSPKCFEYATTIELKSLSSDNRYSNRLVYTFAYIYNYIEEYAIEYGLFGIVENMLKVYDEELNNSALATSSSLIYKGTYVFSDYDRTRYLVGRIIPFSGSTITKLLDLNQIDLCKKLIAHNKKAWDVLTKMRSSYAKPRDGFHIMTDSEIERYLQLHSDIPEEEKTIIRCIKDGIIIPEEVKRLDNLKLVRKILDSSYFNYFEIACECYTNNNYRKLFELLVDLNYSDIARRLIHADDDDRVSIVRNLYSNFANMPNKLEEAHLRAAEQEARNKFGIILGRNTSDAKTLELEYKKYVIVKMYEYILAQKEALYEFVNQKIEERLKAQRDAEERAKIVKGLDKEYFENLLSKNETRLFVLDLCSLFDAILKFDLKCEGEDFFTRMTTYFNNGPKSQSCDDGWGYYVLDTKHEEEVVIPWNKKKELFNRLRIQRNNIAHSESKPVQELSHEELRECLLFVMSINKEEK